MCPQSADVHSCIVTLVALVWLFSTVGSLMCPQIACMRGCIITQIAFECLSSIVHFQMSLQMVCPRECFITQAAFVWFFPTVCFHVCPQIAFARGRIIALVAFVQPYDIFNLCLEDFHNLLTDVTNFNHNHSLHIIVLLPIMATSWYWGKSEFLGNIRSVLKRESENRFYVY